MDILIEFIVSLVDLLLMLTRPFSDMVLNVLHRMYYGASKPLPPINNAILLMSATKLAKKIRRREISASDVMRVYISRIEGVQPVVNACVENRFEEALADARAVDRMLESGVKTEAELAAEMPLLGVPFTCKEVIGVKHLSQTNGVPSLRKRKAPEDADVVVLYRKAGAIPVVVTNVPTMSLWHDTHNRVYGATKNPYDTHRIPGGSSGGEASLIASAGAVIGLGNDLGGSIRLPSSMCGIYGHKPSEGVISNNNAFPVEVPEIYQFVSTGPMCRYAEDLNLLVGLLAGNDRRKLRLDEKVNFKKVKVYYIEEFPGYTLSATPDIKAAVRKAAKHFEEEYNVKATELKIDELRHAFQIWQSKLFEAAGPFVRAMVVKNSMVDSIDWEYVKSFLRITDYDYRILYYCAIEPKKKDLYYKRGLAMFRAVEKRLDEVLSGDAILILPVQPEPPSHSITTVPKFKKIGYTGIFNMLGLPGTSVPAGFSKGLPIGLQVIATKNNDRLTLAAAAELDKVFGGWKSPCPVLA